MIVHPESDRAEWLANGEPPEDEYRDRDEDRAHPFSIRSTPEQKAMIDALFAPFRRQNHAA